MIKTICIAVSDGAVARNILATAFLRILAKDNKVILIVPAGRESRYGDRFGSLGVEVVGLTHTKTMREKVCSFVATNAFKSETLVLMQQRAQLEGKSRIPLWIKHLVVICCANGFMRRLIRFLDKRAGSVEVAKLFDTYTPDTVVSTMLLDSVVDLPLMREAARRGIRTVGMVRSWDNLTTYGFLRYIPNVFVAQNQFIKDMATHRHDVPASRIKVTGLPHYDAYQTSDAIVSRDQFCQSLNIDPSKKIILYAALGDFLFPAEPTLVPLFNELIEQKTLPSAHVIFRAHPAHGSAADTFSLPHVTFDRSVTYYSDSYGDWEITDRDEVHLKNSLYHADAIVTASGTSILVDGAVFDKPLVSIAFDGTKKQPYWFSIARFLDHAVHSKALVEQGGVEVVYNKEALTEALRVSFDNPLQNGEGRAQIRKLLAEPLGGSSERLAHIVSGQ